jgi:hypothetical protein
VSRGTGRRWAAIGGTVVLGLVLASCSPPAPASDASAVPAGLPPAQALPGSGGTWATLTMGRAGDALDTFGEVFFHPGCAPGSGCAGGAPWSLVTPPGVASNGGILIAAGSDGDMTAGFGVSLDLRFSPLAATTDAGSTWNGGILPVALAPRADALATSGPSHRLALAAPSPVGTGAVYTAGSDLSTWTREVTHGDLAGAAARSGCSLGALSAVAVTAPAPGGDLVAGDCTGGGRAGVFRIGTGGRAGAVADVGPRVTSGGGGPVRVLRLVARSSGVSALVASGAGADTRLELATSTDGEATWTVSAAYAPGRSVVSTSVTDAGGFVVLLGGGRAAAAIEPGQAWRSLPPPPAGTAVIASLGTTGTFEALVPSGSDLEVDALGPSGWRQVQRLAVPIQYGSTSAGGGPSG